MNKEQVTGVWEYPDIVSDLNNLGAVILKFSVLMRELKLRSNTILQ